MSESRTVPEFYPPTMRVVQGLRSSRQLGGVRLTVQDMEASGASVLELLEGLHSDMEHALEHGGVVTFTMAVEPADG